jgi:hypothetical protein
LPPPSCTSTSSSRFSRMIFTMPKACDCETHVSVSGGPLPSTLQPSGEQDSRVCSCLLDLRTSSCGRQPEPAPPHPGGREHSAHNAAAKDQGLGSLGGEPWAWSKGSARHDDVYRLPCTPSAAALGSHLLAGADGGEELFVLVSSHGPPPRRTVAVLHSHGPCCLCPARLLALWARHAAHV